MRKKNFLIVIMTFIILSFSFVTQLVPFTQDTTVLAEPKNAFDDEDDIPPFYNC